MAIPGVEETVVRGMYPLGPHLGRLFATSLIGRGSRGVRAGRPPRRRRADSKREAAGWMPRAIGVPAIRLAGLRRTGGARAARSPRCSAAGSLRGDGAPMWAGTAMTAAIRRRYPPPADGRHAGPARVPGGVG